MAGQTDAPVLLLHGGGYDSASRSYKQSIGPISQYHKVFAPDWPGFGESDKPKMRYSTEFYVDFLGHLMDALGLEKASLVGISMGGAISLGFSLRWPRTRRTRPWCALYGTVSRTSSSQRPCGGQTRVLLVSEYLNHRS